MRAGHEARRARIKQNARRRLGKHMHQCDAEYLTVGDAAQETDRCYARKTLIATGEDAQ